MFNRSGAPFLTSTKGVTSMARPYLYYSCAEFTMTYSASAVFLIFIILFAFASAALLDALRYEHCESTSSFLLLYLPLFLVNNVFVTLVVFIYWIASEKKHPTAVNHRFARRWIYDSASNSRPAFRKEIAHSFYDNVLPWEYVKLPRAEYV